MKSDIERFMVYVVAGYGGASSVGSECWVWAGSPEKDGYGRFMAKGRRRPAHAFAYRHFVGEYSDDMEIDHLCRNHKCVNPSHLEPVTHQENAIRGMAGKHQAARGRAITHCPKGHEFTPDNTYINRNAGLAEGCGRRCKTCARITMAARRQANKL